ncbi:MAG: zinc ribbon domain-containing protein [Candidatus Omnitrophota bacterium]
MPLYEYQCKKCDHTFTRLVKKSRLDFWKRLCLCCPQCKSKQVSRKFSSFTVSSTQSRADTLNELSKLGPVNFVPQYPGINGPPPGGCPYAKEQDKAVSKPKSNH